MSRAVALIDGEHYPPVVRFALESLAATHDVAAAVFVGGTEKVDAEAEDAYGVPLVRGLEREAAVRLAIEQYEPDVIVDLSDEPVLSAADRFVLASIALSLGVEYRGADFAFTPPRIQVVPATPALAIIGTGKRVGKTAISAYAARELKSSGLDVAVLAMGRGGPAEPELIRGEQVSLTTPDLLALARQGKHASSDNYEDAVMSRVTTVGCRRCGGGLAGETFFSNVPEGARLADSLGKELLILEGSGAAIPPVHADANLLVVAANRGLEYVDGYFGPYRLSRADLAIVAFAEQPSSSAEEVEAIRAAIAMHRPDLPVVATTFRPFPIEPVEGRRVLFATTAPEEVAGTLAQHLSEVARCDVVGVTARLSDRRRLRQDLERYAGSFDVVVSELKAAAIDVVAAEAEAVGVPTVLCDNVPVATDGSNLRDAVLAVARTAQRRAASRKGDAG